jgi:hypothetical protein
MAIQWLFCCHVPHNLMANDQNFPHTIAAAAMLPPMPTVDGLNLQEGTVI